MLVFVVNNIKLSFISFCFLTSCKISFEFLLLPWLQPYFLTRILTPDQNSGIRQDGKNCQRPASAIRLSGAACVTNSSPRDGE